MLKLGRRESHSGGPWLTPSYLPYSILQDVCAGIVLIAEAGGRVVPSQPPTAAHLSDRSLPIPDADLGSRLYLAVRPCADTADESGREAQDRLVREIWRRTELLDYKRPT